MTSSYEAAQKAWQSAVWQRALTAYAQHLEERHGVHHAAAIDVANCVAAHVRGDIVAGGCVPGSDTAAFTVAAETLSAEERT